MRTFLIVLAGMVLGLGCARVRVEAPKEPIKVDVSMRLDIYQHIEKDIDQIENIVSGSAEKTNPGDQQGLLDYFMTEAYAAEGLSPQVEEAALRRRDRLATLSSLESQGIIGENESGLVEIRRAADADESVAALVRTENEDRMVIYKEVAGKNGTSVEEVQKLYAKRLQSSAPSGTPIEVRSSGGTEWTVKP